MPVAFNPFNPATYWTAFLGGSSRATFPRQPRPAPGTPVEINARASDAGIDVEVGRDSLTVRGTAAGAEPARDFFGTRSDAAYAKSVSFSLDADKAPTEDIYGRTNYREKNARLFNVYTKSGWSAEEVANRLADKVNDARTFRAKVETQSDGSATIHFSRR